MAAGTPLYMAVLWQQVEQVHQLLQAGVNVREPSGVHAAHQNMTPLRLAVNQKNGDIVHLLLQFGADINERVLDETLLHKVARRWMGCPGTDPESEAGGLNVARRLIQHGVDVSARDDRGWTALHMAAVNLHVQMVRVLLDCQHLNFQDRTPVVQTAEDMVSTLRTNGQQFGLLPDQPFNVDAQREIIAMLKAEPERRTQERRAAFAMALIPRLGVASPVAALDVELVRMVLETP
jgi:ankyrin repeat protein